MTYDELQVITDKAWDSFLDVFDKAGMSVDDLTTALHHKDCFNDVDDAIMNVVVLEREE